MSLARVKTWNPGDILTANDQNAEFNNILNNPISLVSPTTGAINFNLQSHTNLIPAALSGTSGSTGNALVISTAGTPVWGAVGGASLTTGTLSTGALLVYSSNGVIVPLVQGTTGTVLAVTSSGVSPSFQVLPPSGGLSTGTASTGALYYISTDGKYVPLTIGTSGQILTVSTASKPTWATAAAAGVGNGPEVFSTANDLTFFEDYTVLVSSQFLAHLSTVKITSIAFSPKTGASWNLIDPFTRVSFSGMYQGLGGALSFYSTTGTGNGIVYNGNDPTSQYASTQHLKFTTRFVQNSTATGTIFIGFTTQPAATALASTVSQGIYFTFNGNTTSVTAQAVTSSGGVASLAAGVSSTAFHTYVMTITSSAVGVTVDGTSVGSLGSSGIPNIPLALNFGSLVADMNTSAGIIVDAIEVITSGSMRV